jgi:NAD(P)-dependent dehydrogenase (short-subunit alcohol dehydrogenase family)
MRGLQGNTYVVTGGGSGIGLAAAQRLAAEGAKVAAWDVATTEGWDELAASGADVLFCELDVRDGDATAEVAAAVRSTLGPISGIVTAAGVAGGGRVHELGEQEWERVVGINLTGTYLSVKHALPDMIEAGHGSIVTIASVEGLEGAEGGSAYNASKGGVILLTKNLAMDYGASGIRANAVCPGFIDTPMFRSVMDSPGMSEMREKVRKEHTLRRFGRAEELGDTCAYLLSDDASFISGVALPVDGGYTAGHSLGFFD